MDVVFLIGRILFALIFLVSAVGHLTQTDAMAGYASSKGVPNAKLATFLSGVVIAVGAILIVLGLWADLGALLLVLFLVPTAFVMHAFWKETDPMAKQMEQVQFNKDIALAGAALVLFFVFQQGGDAVPFTVAGALF